MQQLISIDLKGDFAYFKKPDINSGLQLTYNLLHKPALLGILGAIAGLEGYKKKGSLPEYYEALKTLPIGIEPLNHQKGNYSKTKLTYTNTIGYANDRSNFIANEMLLIAPAYRCYLLLDTSLLLHQKILDYLSKGQAEYVPYFGKNEYPAWWEAHQDGFKVYDFEAVSTLPAQAKVSTLFKKGDLVINQEFSRVKKLFGGAKEALFVYFERLPIRFDEQLFQYQLEDFVFTNFSVKTTKQFTELYYLKDRNSYVQLF